MEKKLIISVVDDDESMRESLPALLQELGYDSRTFSSAEEFLKLDGPSGTDCLILDVAMPGMGGPDLKRELTRQKHTFPVIFITAHRDEAVRSQMIQDGAIDCLFKPFSDTALSNALDLALPQE